MALFYSRIRPSMPQFPPVPSACCFLGGTSPVRPSNHGRNGKMTATGLGPKWRQHHVGSKVDEMMCKWMKTTVPTHDLSRLKV